MHQPEKTGLTRIQLVAYSLGGLAMNLTDLVVSQWLFESYVIGGIVSAATFSGVLLGGNHRRGIGPICSVLDR